MQRHTNHPLFLSATLMPAMRAHAFRLWLLVSAGLLAACAGGGAPAERPAPTAVAASGGALAGSGQPPATVTPFGGFATVPPTSPPAPTPDNPLDGLVMLPAYPAPTDRPYVAPTPNPEPYPPPYPIPAPPNATTAPTYVPLRLPIPTAAPAQLRVWTTPTPTPLQAQAEQARQFLSRRQNIPPSRLLLAAEQIATRRSTGAELRVTLFQESASGRYFAVAAEPSGEIAELPDFAEQAIAYVAREKQVPAEQLLVSNQSYVPLPLTRQLIWSGRVVLPENQTGMDIYLDIDGTPVDLGALWQAERSARQASCPKLDDQLCLYLLEAPAERIWEITIALQQGANPAAVLQRLPPSSALLQPDLIRAELSGRAIQDLARLDEVARIARS